MRLCFPETAGDWQSEPDRVRDWHACAVRGHAGDARKRAGLDPAPRSQAYRDALPVPPCGQTLPLDAPIFPIAEGMVGTGRHRTRRATGRILFAELKSPLYIGRQAICEPFRFCLGMPNSRAPFAILAWTSRSFGACGGRRHLA